GGRAPGQRQVQVVGRDDVDGLDVRVVGDAVEVVVAVDVAVGDAVLLLPLRDLLRRAGDDAGEVAVAGQLQPRGEQGGGVVAEADQRHADRVGTATGRRAIACRGGGSALAGCRGRQRSAESGRGHGG